MKGIRKQSEIINQLQFQVLLATKYSSNIVKVGVDLNTLANYGVFFVFLHEISPTLPNKLRSGRLKIAWRCDCVYQYVFAPLQ